MLRIFVRTSFIVLTVSLLSGTARAVDTYENSTLNAPVFSQETLLRNVTIQNGFTLQNANVTIERLSTSLKRGLALDGAQSIGGTGTISFTGTTYLPSLYSLSGSFSIGSGITVATGGASALVGGIYDTETPETWTNHGTLWSNTAGQSLTLLGNWHNDGTLKVSSGGTLQLGGSFATADVAGHVQRDGGALVFSGIIDNTGAMLDVAAFGGTVQFADGRINGGTLLNSAGATITAISAQLNQVTIGSDLAFGGSESTVQAEGLTLANGATLRVDQRFTLGFGTQTSVPQTIAGNGTILLNGGTFDSYNEPVVIGPQTTIAGHGRVRMDHGLDNQGTIVASGGGSLVLSSSAPAAGWINHGLLAAHNGGTLVVGTTIAAGGLGSFDSSGGAIYLTGQVNNAGNTLALNGPGNNLNLGGTLSGGTVQAGGGAQFTLQGPIDNTGVIVDGVSLDTDVVLGTSVTGYLRNGTTLSAGHILYAKGSGSALRFDSDLAGEIRLQDATTNGTQLNANGTLTTIGSGLTIRGDGGNGGIGSDSTQTGVNVLGKIWNNGAGSIQIGNFSGSVTNDGWIEASAGTITTHSPLVNHNWVYVDGGTLRASSLDNTAGKLRLYSGGLLQLAGIVDPFKAGDYYRSGGSVSINGQFTNASSTSNLSAAFGTFSFGDGAAIVGGTIGYDATQERPGSTLEVTDGLVNFAGAIVRGTINVDPGATLRLISTDVRSTFNTGTINANSATLNWSTNLRNGQFGTINATNTTFRTQGQVLNEEQTFPYFAIPGGTFELAGWLHGGTISNAGDNVYLGGDLDNVTLAGKFTLSSGHLATLGTVTFATDSSITLNNFDELDVGLGSLLGSGTVMLDGANRIAGEYSFSTFTIGSGVTIRTGLGGGTLSVETINQGTVSSQTAGRKLTLGARFNNQGVVQAINGGTLAFASAPRNASGGLLTGGTWFVGDGSTMTLGTTLLTNNATIHLDGPTSTLTTIDLLASNQGTFILSGGRNLISTVATMSNSGLFDVGVGSVLKVKGLANTGLVQLGGGLIVDYSSSSPLATLRDQIGSGIATTLVGQTIGYAEASELNITKFLEVPVDATSVVMRCTLAGDNNLDGKVDIVDLGLLAGNWHSTTADWFDGDYNYDGKIDIVDLGLLAGNWHSDTPLAAALAQFDFTAVPEPMSLSVMFVSIALVRRRRGY